MADSRMYDLIIRGGRVVDPSRQMDRFADVALAGGRVALAASDIPASAGKATVDASGCLVTPGLIDMHTHIYWGVTPLSIEADRYLADSCTTTWVDAGSSGAATFPAFRRFLIETSATRIVPLLNISMGGLVNHPAHEQIEAINADKAYDTIEANRDLIVGIKVLSSGLNVAYNDLTPLRIAREVGEATGLPVMCHIGIPPPGLWGILPIMRPGDIITHAYKGRKGCLVIAGNKVRPEAWEARERGVLFDIGHGSGSFSWEVAEAALQQGFPPDAISTDVHNGSINGPAFSMPSVMSKFLHLGMELTEVVRLSTVRPAEMLGLADEIGTLRPGACGDVAVLRIEEGQFPLRDCEKVERVLSRRLAPVLTIRTGKVMTERCG